MGLPDAVFSSRSSDSEPKQLELRQKLVAFVRSLVPPFSEPEKSFPHPISEMKPPLDLSAEPPRHVIGAVEDRRDRHHDPLKGEEWYPGVAWTDWLMLQWIANLPEASVQSRNLIRGIQRRCLYKRIATFARKGPHDMLIQEFQDKRWPERVEICRNFHKEVYARLKRDWTHLNTVTPMGKDDLDKLASEHLMVIIDLPRPDHKVGYDRPLGVVPELKERLYHQDARQAFEDTQWRDIMKNMVGTSAPLRILCHPDVRTIVSAAYAPTDPRSAETLESKLAKVLADAMGLSRQ